MAGDIPYPVKVMGKFPKKVGSKIMEETPIHILQRHPLFLLAQFHAMFLISHSSLNSKFSFSKIKKYVDVA